MIIRRIGIVGWVLAQIVGQAVNAAPKVDVGQATLPTHVSQAAEQFMAHQGANADESVPVFILTTRERAEASNLSGAVSIELGSDGLPKNTRGLRTGSKRGFKEIGSSLKHYPGDFVEYFKSPIRWDTKDWLIAGSVVAGTAALFLVDQHVWDFTQDHKNKTLDRISDVLSGNNYFYGGQLALFFAGGYLFGDERLRRTVLTALEAVALTAGIIKPIASGLTQRHTPDRGDGPFQFDGPAFSYRHISFLSGHTATNFAIAAVVSAEYSEYPLVPIVAYGLASLVGLSRMYEGSHWASDVFLGAAVGFFTGHAIYRLNKHRLFKRLGIVPWTNARNSGGVVLTYVFE